MKRILFSIVCISLVSACFAGTDASDKNAQLIQAAKDGNLSAVQTALANGADINAKDNDGWTPLFFAADAGHKGLVELLLASKAEVNAKSNAGNTPLHKAAHNGHKDVTELLLANKADINAKDEDGSTPLHEAAMGEPIDKSEPRPICFFKWTHIKQAADGSIIDANGIAPDLTFGGIHIELQTNVVGVDGGYVVVCTKKYGKLKVKMDMYLDCGGTFLPTPSQSADLIKLWKTYSPVVEKNHRDVVELLLANKADINAKDKYGWTPLHRAVSIGRKGVIELLLASKADINATTQDGCSALYYSALHGDADIVKLLLEKGADVNLKDMNNGATALYMASQSNHPEVVKLLLAAKADVDVKVKIGGKDYTPLSISKETGHTEIVTLLEKAGAEKSEAGTSGKNAQLIQAEENPISIFSVGSEDVNKVKEILAVDPTAVNARDENGSTPLHRLARIRIYNVTFNSNARGIAEEVKETEPSPVAVLLISKGADVNAKDKKGATPLHWAIANGNFALTKLLVEKGANVNAVIDNDPNGLEGNTPLMFAVANGDTNTMSLLITKGADVNKPDKKGDTPLHIAVAYDQLSAAEILLKKGAKTDIKNSEGMTPLSLALEKGRKQLVDLLRQHGAK